MRSSTATAVTRRPTSLAPTRLAQFIEKEGLSVSRLSRLADVNLSYLFALKAGGPEPTRFVMEKLRRAATELTGRETVSVTELFDFGA